MPDLVGHLKRGYQIQELIGWGGMAEVYKAWDTRRQYDVAVRMMREGLHVAIASCSILSCRSVLRDCLHSYRSSPCSMA